VRESPFEVVVLLELILRHVPIKARLLPWAVNKLCEEYPELRAELEKPRQVIDASYFGDSGGILCRLDLSARAHEATEDTFVQMSITGLALDPRTPDFRIIQRYQKKRLKDLKRGLYDLGNE
jgi:hypothetical protein